MPNQRTVKDGLSGSLWHFEYYQTTQGDNIPAC
jgi:hypothetical protein